MDTALVIGRFQPLHRGHWEAVRRILKRHSRLLILIGSSNKSGTAENPFSALERRGMIEACLKDAGLLKRVSIGYSPDVGNNERWVRAAKKRVKSASVLYTNNPLVRRLFSPFLEVKPMRSGIRVSATQVRAWMREGNPKWKALVPKPACYYLLKRRLVGRVVSGN